MDMFVRVFKGLALGFFGTGVLAATVYLALVSDAKIADPKAMLCLLIASVFYHVIKEITRE